MDDLISASLLRVLGVSVQVSVRRFFLSVLYQGERRKPDTRNLCCSQGERRKPHFFQM